MKYKTLDLFAGIGGIRKGFELTGKFENVLSAEIDIYACKTYMHLYNEDPQNDVSSPLFKKQVEKIKYDVLLGGFPCQAFSSAGKKEGFKDTTRGTLFFDIADIIDRTRPKAFLLENVEGLITHKKGSTFKVILNTLVKELNYSVVGVDLDHNGEVIYNPRSFILNSKNFGVPQNRPRIYLIGFNKDYYKNDSNDIFPELPKKRKKKPIFRNINDILESNVSEKFYLSEGYLQTLIKHKKAQKAKGNGFGYSIINHPEIINPISNALLATGGSGKERNLVLDYKKDLVGKVVKNKKTPLNSLGLRTLTPTEWGKLQGFIGYAFVNKDGNDNFSLPLGISDTQLYKQFGNSVTIPVIEELAYKIYETLNYLDSKSIKNIEKSAIFS